MTKLDYYQRELDQSVTDVKELKSQLGVNDYESDSELLNQIEAVEAYSRHLKLHIDEIHMYNLRHA
jgi:phosphatidate phosphatase PAH1